MCRYCVLNFTLYYDVISGDKISIQKIGEEDKRVKGSILNQRMIRFTARQDIWYEV